jgi:hypothetical protein
VSEGTTGFLADTFEDYQELLEELTDGTQPPLDPVLVSKKAWEMHQPEKKCARLNRLYREVLSKAPTAVDDGFPDMEAWLEFQIGDFARAASCRRPTLRELRADEATLQAHQCWACEGGLAHYAKQNQGIRSRLESGYLH